MPAKHSGPPDGHSYWYAGMHESSVGLRMAGWEAAGPPLRSQCPPVTGGWTEAYVSLQLGK